MNRMISLALVGLVVGTGCLAYFFYTRSSALERELHEASIVTDKLSKEKEQLSSQLSTFKDISKKDVLNMCKERAAIEYSQYINENSVSSKEGNVTTITPKSSDILRTAEKNLQDANSSCQSKYGD